MADGDGVTDIVDLSGNGKGVALNVYPVFALPRYTTANRMLVIFGEGHLIYDIDLDAVFVGDGVTFGGNQLGEVTTPIGEAPANTVAPVISGELFVGQLLSVSNGTWTGTPTSYAYQWKRAGVAIVGATNNTYTTVEADADVAITCTVTATNATDSTEATSASVIVVMPFAFIDLFTASDGIWIDPNDAATVTTDGDGIVGIADKSGNGNDLERRWPGFPITYPELTTIDGVDYVQWDADNTVLYVPSVSFNRQMTMFQVVDVDGDTQYDLAGQGVNTLGTAWPAQPGPPSAGSGTPGWYINGIRGNSDPTATYTRGGLSTDLAAAGKAIVEVRNADLSAWTAFSVGSTTADGHFTGTTGDIIVCNDPTAYERQETLNMLADIHGITLDKTELHITGYLNDHGSPLDVYGGEQGGENGKLVRSASFARLIFRTTATTLTIHSWNNLGGHDETLWLLDLWVDGVFQQIAIAGDGTQSNEIILDAGEKIIELRRPPNTGISGQYRSTWPTKIVGNADIQLLPMDKSSHTVFYGDSITCGANATTPGDAFPMLFRDTLDVSVGVEAWGGRWLYFDADTSDQRDNMVDVFQNGWGCSRIVMMIGTNDWAANWQTAANFGTDYAALLDAINAAMPSVEIICVSPLWREVADGGVGGPNAGGETLQQYRDQIETVCSTRTGFVTFVDGFAILDATDMAGTDGTHPNSAGHVKIFDALEPLLA